MKSTLYFLRLGVAVSYFAFGHWLSARDPLPAEVVSKVGEIWEILGPDSDISGESGMLKVEDFWRQVAEIGEENATRALIMLYQQRLGIDRPRKGPSPENKEDPRWHALLFNNDSHEKSRIVRLLARDARMIDEFLPIIRQRLVFLVDNVSQDQSPTEVDGMELWATAIYLRQWGDDRDSAMLDKLYQEYASSELRNGASKAATLEDARVRIEHYVEANFRMPPPFIPGNIGWMSPPGSKVAGKPGKASRSVKRDAGVIVGALPASESSATRWAVGFVVAMAVFGGLALYISRGRRQEP